MISRQISRLLILTTFVLVVVLSSDGTVTSSASAGPKGPTAPTSLVVTSVTETTIGLSWQASKHNRPFAYHVSLVNLNNPGYNQVVSVSQSQTSYTAQFLPPGHTFSVKVYAIDSQGHRSADSNTVTATTLADMTPPSAPTLEATTLGPSQVRLSWTRSTDNIPLNCCSYRIVMNDNPVTRHINWGSETSVIIRHLTPASTNTFRVIAVDFAGNPSTSNPSTATTDPSTDTVAPTVPTNLHIVRENGCAELWLGWTEATDDIDPQSAIEYEIYINGVLSTLAVSAGVSEDFVYGVGGENIFTIRAVDRTGNSSAASAPVVVQLWPC